MQKSLSNPAVRAELLDRLTRLTPDSTGRWGRMNATQMLAHLVDWMAMAQGTLSTAPIGRILRYPFIKQLAIYWLPFPRNVMTAPELKSRKPREWAIEREQLRQQLQSFATAATRAELPDHPAFGSMSARAWSVFAYRHTDHHFRQFGV